MINSQMTNPFMIGDLVHLAQGTMMYEISPWDQYSMLPEKVLNKPSVGLVISKLTEVEEAYRVSIGQDLYIVKNEDMVLITRKG